jgi:hypothetical protein
VITEHQAQLDELAKHELNKAAQAIQLYLKNPAAGKAAQSTPSTDSQMQVDSKANVKSTPSSTFVKDKKQLKKEKDKLKKQKSVPLVVEEVAVAVVAEEEEDDVKEDITTSEKQEYEPQEKSKSPKAKKGAFSSPSPARSRK